MKKCIKKLWCENKMVLVLTSAVILLQTVIGVLLWDKLPEEIATHFDFSNQPNGYSSRAFTVFGMPLVLLALHWICLLAECAPNRQKVRSDKLRSLILFIVPAVSLMMTVLCYGYALGIPFNIGRVVMPFIGTIFVIVGNYLPKIRRNPTMGIRLPWTLMDDENWYKTHRFAAPVWVLCGIVLIVLGLIGYTQWPAMGAIFAAILLPMAYSFALYIRKRENDGVS